MVFSREDLRNQLKRREIAPVYLLFGPETHLLELAVKTITDFAFAPGDLRDFNENAFSLNTDGNLKRAFAAAEQLPMMATRRVVRITDVRISATGFRDTILETDEPVLTAYLSNPSPNSVVILVADELNGVRKMGKFLREKAAAVEFARLDDRELTKWARDMIREAEAEIDEPTLRHLVTRVGPDVRRLTNEINKLAAAALPATTISSELVDALVPNSRELDHFEITKHLIDGSRSRAIAALCKILDDGVEPLQLLGLIAYNYRSLLIAKELMMRGADRREVTNMVRLPQSRQEPFLAAARRTDVRSLSRSIQRLAKADLDIKTSKGGGGPVGTRMQLEMLVCDLAIN
jgi:DNA polymerase-3 subunit delta